MKKKFIFAALLLGLVAFGTQAQSVRRKLDRKEDHRDRREDKRDRKEDVRDRKEDIRDKREDFRDAKHNVMGKFQKREGSCCRSINCNFAFMTSVKI